MPAENKMIKFNDELIADIADEVDKQMKANPGGKFILTKLYFYFSDTLGFEND